MGTITINTYTGNMKTRYTFIFILLLLGSGACTQEGAPEPEPDPIVQGDFRSGYWQETLEEIKQREQGYGYRPLAEHPDRLTYRSHIRNHTDHYFFQNGVLVEGQRVRHTASDAPHLGRYDEEKARHIALYGPPTEELTEWDTPENEELHRSAGEEALNIAIKKGHLRKWAFWETNKTYIDLMVGRKHVDPKKFEYIIFYYPR